MFFAKLQPMFVKNKLNLFAISVLLVISLSPQTRCVG